MKTTVPVLLMRLFGVAILAIAGLIPISAVAQERTLITVATGGVTGVYYPAGGAICRLVNKNRKIHNIRCSVESTGGSVENIGGIRSGEYEIAVVQSDWQHHAYYGTSKFAEDGAFTDLRALFSIHAEPFTVVARADAGIRDLNDLPGKRVNVGNPGSGQRGTMEVVMAAKGWVMDDFAAASELTSTEQSSALCGNRIDAMIFVVGHPSGSIKEATISCDSVLVDVTDPAIDRLIADTTYYRRTVIPGGTYRGTDEDIRTFGVGATIVSSTATPPDVIYEVVKAVFEAFDTFRMLHPAFKDLKKEEIVRDGLSAPLHAGAQRYFEEAGLIQ